MVDKYISDVTGLCRKIFSYLKGLSYEMKDFEGL
jgi:hypothetical protein